MTPDSITDDEIDALLEGHFADKNPYTLAYAVEDVVNAKWEELLLNAGMQIEHWQNKCARQDAALTLALAKITELQEDLTRPMDGYYEAIDIAISAIKGVLK